MPHCPLQAKRCGGCTRLSVPYEQQLQFKQKRLEKLFDRVMPIEGMHSPYRYRNKIIAAVAHDRNGLMTGQYVYGTHYVLRQEDCLLENEEAVRIVNTARRILNDHHVLSWDENKRTGLLRFIQVRYAARTGQALVTFVTTSDSFTEELSVARELRAEMPSVRGVIRNINDRPGSAVLGFEEHVLDGESMIEDRMCGLKVFLSSRAFYQVNTVMAERLYQKAISLAELSGRESVLDAYCGTGLIGMLAAEHAGQVVGIEQNPSAVRLAQRIAVTNGISKIRFERGDAASVLKNSRLKADVIFLDPPRDGLSSAMTDAIGAICPEKVIYISCNPETQVRDIGVLSTMGYQVSPVWPFDLFPHTDHVETVALLSKLSEAKHHIEVKVDMDELDLTSAEAKATYKEIQDWVQEKYGFHVTNLNIAQVKQKHGIIERENYNKPKSENSKQPGCSAEKVKAIEDAMKYFQMID